MKFTLFLFMAVLLALPAQSAPVCRAIFSDSGLREITVEGVADPALQSRLQNQIETTRAFYENFFGTVSGDITIVAKGSRALRTGYNFKEDNLQFPSIEKVKNHGLESRDIMNHELFHLFTCRKFPALCPADLGTRPELQKVHEALADYFAFKLHPGTLFGENYYTGRPYVRQYQTDLLLGLTGGPHAEANVLVRFLILNNISLQQIRHFLESNPSEQNLKNLTGLSPAIRETVQKELDYQVFDTVLNTTESKLRRYRLTPGETLKVKFSLNDNLRNEYPDLKIRFRTESGSESASFVIQSGDGLNFDISLKTGAKAEKLLAIFYSKEKELGSRAFYLGPQLP